MILRVLALLALAGFVALILILAINESVHKLDSGDTDEHNDE